MLSWSFIMRSCVSLGLMLTVAVSQAVPPPHFHNSYEEETNSTIDELISNAMGGVDVAANMMLAPGGHVLAELDMYLTDEQFINLYPPPAPEQMMDMISAPLGPSSDEAKTRHKRKATRSVTRRWPKGEMPYLFAKGHFQIKEEYMMRRAMTEWERYTCVTFRPATDADANIVRFQNGNGCNSQLGMVGHGIQVLNLQEGGCRYKGLYLHEIGHALGLVHEHQLPDRDNYIRIKYHNVNPHMRVWFNKYSSAEVNQMNVPYELSSVMHYGVTAFSKDGKSQTIEAKDKSKEHTIGRVYLKELAYTDVMIVNAMYNCASKCPDQNKCGRDGHLDQYCNCICRDGSKDCDLTKSNSVDRTCINRYDSWSCYIWANQGECLRNPTYMNENCAKACGSCGGNKDKSGGCKDAHSATNCATWKVRGDCATNYKWMEENCAATCDLCKGVDATTPSTNCNNKHSDSDKCDEWAVMGECQVNKMWMSQNCAKSCRVCDGDDSGTDTGTGGGTGGGGTPDEDKLECVDKHDNCQRWAKAGECNRNPSYMINNCRKSCNKCDDETCKNLYDDTECKIWEQKLRCMTNAEWMGKHCAKVCLAGPCKNFKPSTTKSPIVTTTRKGGSVTDAPCTNKHGSDTECSIWAENDHCNINPSWMGKYCTKACGQCTGDNNDKPTTTTTTATSSKNNYCEDAKPACVAWAKGGFCESNPRYNLIFCKKACNNCNGCRDESVLCPVWAKAKQCDLNARFMLRRCQKSCNACRMSQERSVLQPGDPSGGEETTTETDSISGSNLGTSLLISSCLLIVCALVGVLNDFITH